jgi:hypothetical protein
MKRLAPILMVLLLFHWFESTCMAQNQTGHITGNVVDKQSQVPIPGVNITILQSTRGTISDTQGRFTLDQVPVGRVDVQFSFVGYEPLVIRNLVISSGKYLQMNAELQEKVRVLDEIVIRAFSKDKPMNQMASVSARSFSMEETEKYAGSLGDPSRMVANYAGVVVAGDQRNDIIIRGNSPLGLLWRLEGMNIPNPNHFGTMGTTGGPISILNNNQLENSDFFTGAFPAQYGNALSGVFDLRMRNGNTKKREYLAQMGMNGFELGAEGPMGKDSLASFLVNYRYTMLKLMKALKIIEVAGVPVYQDLSAKIFLPTRKLGTFSLILMGGDSKIKLDEPGESSWTIEMPDGTRAAYHSGMGVIGLHQKLFLNEKVRIENMISLSRSLSSNDVDTIRDGSFADFYKDNYREYCLNLASNYYRKANAANTLQAGMLVEEYLLDYKDEVYNSRLGINLHPTNTSDNLSLLQSYFQWKHAFSNSFSTITGIHAQLLTLNHSFALEPRLGVRWNLTQKQSLSLGYGLHSQMQPRLVYFLRTLTDSTLLTTRETNRNLKFSKSHQVVLGYDYFLTENLRFKVETYCQFLYQIPVEQRSSYYSLANYGAKFYNSKVDSLVNKGKERNYGIELTLEKFLSSNYYYLFTTSIYDSKYTGSDDKWRNSEFNGNFTINALAGYEKQIRNSLLTFNLRVVWAGGKRFVPLNKDASVMEDRAVYDYAHAYEKRYADYFRLDLRCSWKLNRKKISQEFSADIQNITNHRNILTEDYNARDHTEVYTYQMGFFPVGSWRIFF